jgi:outer membrane protein assembly factor BamA
MPHYKIYVFLFLFLKVFVSIALPADSIKLKIDRRVLVLPVAVDAPETKIGLGVVAAVFFRTDGYDSTVRTSNIQTILLYTQRKQLIINLGGNIYFPKENYIIKWQTIYAYYPDRFYGIGNNTPASNKESYTYTQFYFNPLLMRRIYKKWFVGLEGEFQDVLKNDYQPNGIFQTDNIPGRNGYRASGLGPLVAWDSRNNAFSPTKGEYLLLSYLNYNRFVGSQFNFNGFIIDARKYFRSFIRNILAVQFYGQFNNGNVPFRNLAPLGGPNLLRGYYMGRFRDKCATVLQAEYRMQLYKRFGLVAFGGIGEVSDKVANFTFAGIKPAVGGGIRFAIKPKERLNLRLDYAIGQKSSGLYFYVSEAF